MTVQGIGKGVEIYGIAPLLPYCILTFSTMTFLGLQKLTTFSFGMQAEFRLMQYVTHGPNVQYSF